MVTEEIASELPVEEAEVVMAARALSNDIQDLIERIGRMVNEDLSISLIQWHTSLVLKKQEVLKMVWNNYYQVH